MTPTIWYTYFGGMDFITFEDFVSIIQDEDLAIEMATSLLSLKEPVSFNEGDEPQFYSEFYVEEPNREALRAQVKEFDSAFEVQGS